MREIDDKLVVCEVAEYPGRKQREHARKFVLGKLQVRRELEVVVLQRGRHARCLQEDWVSCREFHVLHLHNNINCRVLVRLRVNRLAQLRLDLEFLLSLLAGPERRVNAVVVLRLI